MTVCMQYLDIVVVLLCVISVCLIYPLLYC